MKKAILIILSISFLNLKAQTHIEFMGIPVNGSLSSFIQQLKVKGFKETIQPGLYQGNFAGDKSLLVIGTTTSNIVRKVIISTKNKDSWAEIKYEYFEMVKQYTTKYGSPSSHYELFSNPYYEGDGYEEQALENKKCNYITYWDVKGGIISVSISHTTTFSLYITYEDEINSIIKKKEMNIQTQKDI